MHRRRLPLAYSCPLSLAMMPRRSEAEHWCQSCERCVVDLSALSEKSARAVLDATADTSICIHYKVDRAGQVVFADRPSASGRRVALTLTTLALAVTVSLAGCVGFEHSEFESPDDEPAPEYYAHTPYATPESCDRAEPQPTMSKPGDLARSNGDVGVVVLDRFSGQPLMEVPIRVWSRTKVGVEGATNDQGMAEFQLLEPDRYAVEIVAGLAEATEWIDLAAGTRVEVTFRIDPTTASRFEHGPEPGPEEPGYVEIMGDYDGPDRGEPDRKRRRRR